MPELCRRALTLTCLDNGDVLPVVQLHHLTWCASPMLVQEDSIKHQRITNVPIQPESIHLLRFNMPD